MDKVDKMDFIVNEPSVAVVHGDKPKELDYVIVLIAHKRMDVSCKMRIEDVKNGRKQLEFEFEYGEHLNFQHDAHDFRRLKGVTREDFLDRFRTYEILTYRFPRQGHSLEGLGNIPMINEVFIKPHAHEGAPSIHKGVIHRPIDS